MKKRPDQWIVLLVGVLVLALIWFWPRPIPPEGAAVELHPLVLGPADKPALTLFSWWGCPHCQRLWTEYGPKLVERAMEGEIRLVFRPIARDRSEALVSAFMYCRPPQEAFQSIGDYFAMSALPEQALREQAETRPLLRCADSAATRAQLNADNSAIEQWRIEYTPTLFVEGKRLRPEAMEAVLASWGQ
jgi:protein-disulfide isomerase